MAKTAKTKAKKAPRRPSREGAVAAAIFLLALGLRLFFWHATPDADWSYTAYYKGDAPTWLEYARAIQRSGVSEGSPFELGLPLRPPGNGYLIAALWDGTGDGIAWLRLVWCVLGALAAVLVYGAARRSFGLGIALVTGLWASASTGLLILSTSINNETPYLVLVAAVLYLWRPVREDRRAGVLAVWGLANALACLVRVEHALFFALLLAFLAFSWARDGKGWSRGPSLRASAVVAAAFVLALLPWHLHAWGAIARFNTTSMPLEPGPERAYRQVEAATAHLTWEPGAEEERRRLPAFVRRVAADFVAATVLVRGGERVRAEDFAALEEAFGYHPEPLGGHPFVALYGDLNFYLANNPRASGGFDRTPLEEPPLLSGGASRYPLVMVQGLPPPDLAFLYLPHLRIINHGYRLGWQWIRVHPRDFLGLAGHKLSIFWQGAALGFTGYGLPLGAGGLRRAVDLVVPEGTIAGLWRLALLALVAAVLYRARRLEAILPWVLFLASRVVVTVAFYGYARQGATVIPAVALFAALAVVGPGGGGTEASSRRRQRWLRGALAAGALLAAVEAVRFASGPEVSIDGRPVVGADPIPGDEHADRRVELR